LASPQVISEIRSEKNQFFGIEKRRIKKEKSQFFIGYSESEFGALSLKKIISLAHQEVPQICDGSGARNAFAAQNFSCPL
jgi:hypothetical protein